MEGITLTVAIVASTLVFFLSPVYGLIVYVVTLSYYPTYLSVQVGTIDFTVSRIIILAIYLNIFLNTRLPHQYKFIWLDVLIIIYFMAQLIAGVTTFPLTTLLENRAGAFFDMALPYFAVRMIITTRDQYLTFLKGILVIAAPLAIIGFYQCITGDNPVGFLQKYTRWELSVGGEEGYLPIPRRGFFRANVTFPMSIMFGLFFAVFGPVCASVLWSLNKYKILYITGFVLMAIGVFSSMSSGPWLCALLASAFIAFYRHRRYWKPVLILIISSILIVEIISNRHFYDVLGGYTLQSSTTWYRSRLIDIALFEGGMSGHWLFGYGFEDPGWGPMIDGRNRSWIVNHYLVVLCHFGLVGLVPFLAICIASIHRLIKAFRISILESDKWLVWCLFSGMLSQLIVLVTVCIFGQPITIFSMILGFCGIMPFLVANNNLFFSKSSI